jgi:actin-related protein
MRHNYLENIIITGGNTRFTNFNERLFDELKKNTFNWVTPMIYTMRYCSDYSVTSMRAMRQRLMPH